MFATKRFKVTEDHLRLARRMSVRYEDWVEFGAPAIDPKRPYGNGDVYGDMREILGRLDFPTEDWGHELGDEAGLLTLHKEMATVLQIALRTGSFKAGEYESRAYFEDWREVPSLPTPEGAA